MSRTIFLFLLVLSLTNVEVFGQSPRIATISKTSGTYDDLVGIAGANFSNQSADLRVWFGAMPGVITIATTNFIEARVPPGASTSVISVTNTVTGLTGHSSSLFNLSFSGSDAPFDASLFEEIPFDSFEEIFDLTVVDFDLDGLNDIAASRNEDPSDDLVIFRNTSAANVPQFDLLDRSTNIEFDIKNPVSNLTSGDVDGDGRPDLIASRAGSTRNQIYVFRNISTAGSIKFESAKSYFIDPGQIAKRIVLRDLDDDGKPEITVSNTESNSVSIFMNISTSGNVNFASQQIELEVTGAPSTNGLAIEDVDGDGKADIITNPLFEPNIYVLRNESVKGDIAFSAPFVITLSGNLNNLVVGDLNGDGKNDVAITKTQQSKLAVFLNNTSTDLAFEAVREFDVVDRPWGLDLGDFDGDGTLDIVVTSSTTAEIAYLENTIGSGTFDFNLHVLPQSLNSRNLKVADVSGDAKPDIVSTSFDRNTDDFAMTVSRNKSCFSAKILNAPLQICNGQTIRLNATQGLVVDYVWEQDGIETKNSADPFLDITTPGTYSVRADSENGSCSELSQDFVVTLTTGNIPAAPVVSNDGPACTGESVTLSVQTVTDATYLWAGPLGFSSAVQNPTLSSLTPEMAGNYFVTIFEGQCQSDPIPTLVEVVIPPEFAIQIDGSSEFCEGNSTTLAVDNESGFTYQWIMDGNPISGETSSSTVVSVAGLYAVDVSNVSLGCTISTESVAISTFAPPVASFSFAGDVCSGKTIQFSNTSTTDNTRSPSYSWTFGNDSTSTNSDPSMIYLSAGSYTVSLTVDYPGENCSNNTSQVIDISDPTLFSIAIDGQIPFCQGDSATLSVTESFSQLLWSTGETDTDIVVKQDGVFSVTALNAAGCQSEDSVTVTTFPIPAINISATKTVIQLGDTLTLTASGAGTYSWTPGETLSDSLAATTVASPVVTTTYTVQGVDPNGCSGQSQITIEVDTSSEKLPVDAPRLFSPNGDGVDDFWTITNILNFPQCKIVIFTRNGNTIFEAEPYNNDWDGTDLGGVMMPEGAYFYVISCNDGKSATGSVTIVR